MLLNRKLYNVSEPLKCIGDITLSVSLNDLKRLADAYLDGPAKYRLKKKGKTTIIRHGIMAEYVLK